MNAERATLVKEVKEALLQKYDVYTVSCSRDMAHHFGRWLGELRDAVEQLDAEAKKTADAFGDYIHKCMDCTDKSIKRDKQLTAERDQLTERVEQLEAERERIATETRWNYVVARQASKENARLRETVEKMREALECTKGHVLEGDKFALEIARTAKRAGDEVRWILAILDAALATQPDSPAPQEPTRYRVGCPKCANINESRWTDELPPGGVEPVECVKCGYMILSESEGDPCELIPTPVDGSG